MTGLCKWIRHRAIGFPPWGHAASVFPYASMKLRLLIFCVLLPLFAAGAQELQEQPTPFSAWVDFQTIGPIHGPKQALPIWLESVQRTAQPSNTNAPVKTTFRIRLRRMGSLNERLQMRLFFDDLENASPVISGWSETGEKRFLSQPLGSGLNLATSESLILSAEALDYVDISVPGNGSNVRGAFLATLKRVETLHAIDFAEPAELNDAFANLPASQLSPADTFLFGRVKAGIEAGAITLTPAEAPSIAWQIELDAIPLLAVVTFEILDVDPLHPPEWIINGTPLGGAAIHLPDLADPAYQAVVRTGEPKPRFQYNGWLRGQQAIPSSMLRAGLNKLVLRLDGKSNKLAVRAVEMQLKHHWQNLDYKLVP